jgi:nickel-dependent lactate racemase
MKYGKETIPLPGPLAGLPVLDARGLQAADRPEGLIAEAATDAAARIANRLGTGSGRLALVVPDRTRPLPLPDVLPVLLRELAGSGIPPGRITIVPASGIHRPMDRDELSGWVGQRAAGSGVGLSPHDADRKGPPAGVTESGIRVEVHPDVAEADAVLLLGRIVFHYLAGFGGGRKMLVPGVAARQTVLAVHQRCLAAEPGGGRHRAARAGVLDGNPMNEAACQAASLFPQALAIHISLTTEGKLARVVAGDPVSDHAGECALYATACRASVEVPLDAVVVSGGGYPVDGDLVQAHKALDAVAPIVRDGGRVIFIAKCDRGVGNPELLEGFRLGSPEAIERELRRNFRVGLHTAMAFLEKTRRLEVFALTELPDEILALSGMRRLRSMDEAAAILRASPGAVGRTALAPRGASLLYEVRVSADRKID